MSDTLQLIRKLSEAITPSASVAEAESWWPIVKQIIASLEADPGYTPDEKQALTRVKTTVSEAILAVRHGQYFSRGTLAGALRVLQSTVERR